MPDLVVTCPKALWRAWLAEGDLAGEPETGEEWAWFIGGRRPSAGTGDRLYVVAHGRLRGWAPVTRLFLAGDRWAICRRGGAVACTVGQPIPGFRGLRHRWWERADERPFPGWRCTEAG